MRPWWRAAMLAGALITALWAAVASAQQLTPPSCEDDKRVLEVLVQHLRAERENIETDSARALARLTKMVQQLRADLESTKKKEPPK